MSDVPPSTNAFEKMMAAARGATTPIPATVAADEDEDGDPVYTAVLYEARLEHADPEEPLWRVPYFGQIVRVGTAEEIFATRKRQHETAAAREDKDLGLHAVIDRFGPDAIAWRIVSSESGPRIAMRALANAEEIRLIDENGGVLRDMDAKLPQTLNLTKGGQGDPRAVWEAMDARSKRAYTKFQAAMAKYVEEYDSALVPYEYVDKDGYPLGARLTAFRQGRYWKGTPWEDEVVAWAEALPKWHWNAHESSEYHEALSQRFQQQRDNETAEQKADRVTKFKKTMDNKTAEQKAESLAKLKKTMATDASKAKRRKISTAQLEREVRAELERARTIAVPFEKSKKRRAELRAASKHTKPSGRRGDNVLYMISEDGASIRRVNMDGHMRERDIVGLVVDPPPLDAFDSD